MNTATWYERLILARKLNDNGEKAKSYLLYQSICIDDFQFDKYRYGEYEDYIVDKVKFLVDRAVLEVEVGNSPDKAIKYLEHAIELLDGMESVYPYVKIKEVKCLKEDIVSISKKHLLE